MAPAAGEAHSVLVRSDGIALAVGSNKNGQCQVPELPANLRYVDAAAGKQHTVLLRSDGEALAFGSDEYGQCKVPIRPPPDVNSSYEYVDAAAGSWHTVLIRSDGEAVAFGRRDDSQCKIPAKPDGVRYVSAAAGLFHTVLLRSDGVAVACGDKYQSPACCVPRLLQPDLRYVAVAAGLEHTVLLRSDGVAVAFGRDDGDDRCRIPCARAPLRYVAVAAGWYHTLLLRSDGGVVVCGRDTGGRCQIPALMSPLRYVAVAGGYRHTVLLRSDGVAVACGNGDALDGPCRIPELPPGLRYTTGLEEPLAREDAKLTPAGTVVLEQDQKGTVYSWEALEGGALQRWPESMNADAASISRLSNTSSLDAVPARQLPSPAAPLSQSVFGYRSSLLEAKRGTAWQRMHCPAHKTSPTHNALCTSTSMTHLSRPFPQTDVPQAEVASAHAGRSFCLDNDFSFEQHMESVSWQQGLLQGNVICEAPSNGRFRRASSLGRSQRCR